MRYNEVKKYLKDIENELGDVDSVRKESIIHDIEEHLNEKIEDVRKSKIDSKLSSKDINKILTDFGDPQEITDEYLHQFSTEDKQRMIKKRKKSHKSLLLISVVIAIILISLPIFEYYLISNDNSGLGDKTILEGKGLDSLQIGDDLDKIKEVLGDPEHRQDSDHTTWVVYRDKYGIDFLLSNNSNKIIEIRFNSGYDGALQNGIAIGSTLDEVLKEYNGANKTVEANLSETQNVLLGSDKVLYKQIIDGEITAYKFINAKKGILFWFDVERILTQIVVFSPY